MRQYQLLLVATDLEVTVEHSCKLAHHLPIWLFDSYICLSSIITLKVVGWKWPRSSKLFMIILLDLRDPFGQRIHAKIGELGKESSSGGCAVDFVERKWKKLWGIFTGTKKKVIKSCVIHSHAHFSSSRIFLDKSYAYSLYPTTTTRH